MGPWGHQRQVPGPGSGGWVGAGPGRGPGPGRRQGTRRHHQLQSLHPPRQAEAVLGLALHENTGPVASAWDWTASEGRAGLSQARLRPQPLFSTGLRARADPLPAFQNASRAGAGSDALSPTGLDGASGKPAPAWPGRAAWTLSPARRKPLAQMAWLLYTLCVCLQCAVCRETD